MLSSSALVLPAIARGQEFPTRPIKLLVPFAAGGPMDLVARLVAPGASTELSQQVIVEISFASPVTLNLAQEPFDLFFFRTFDRGHQVHRPQYAGTNTMNMSLFNTGVDSSNGARNFVDNYGLPFVIAVPELVFWTDESAVNEIVMLPPLDVTALGKLTPLSDCSSGKLVEGPS